MIDLLPVIYQQINNAHDYKTYPSPAPAEITLKDGSKIPTPYPHATYKLLPVDGTENDRDDYTLEVSCWDRSESTSHAIAIGIAEDVKQALKRYRHLDEHNLIITSKPFVGLVPDPDEQIKRYDVRTNLLTYRR
ncbi:hypothetical protein [Paraliobacillus sediminis]|uniref:hypothetical protein n=1 Tax=Paraliobacillus sediminis TaxID=1885916 RepID=UPI000E3C853F|nr:hypothetical protein [Paraliobacillus sediminis]